MELTHGSVDYRTGITPTPPALKKARTALTDQRIAPPRRHGQ